MYKAVRVAYWTLLWCGLLMGCLGFYRLLAEEWKLRLLMYLYVITTFGGFVLAYVALRELRRADRLMSRRGQPMGDPHFIGEVVLSPEERLKVRAGEVNGQESVDVRVFVRDERLLREEHSTKQGFAIEKERVPVLVELLREALDH